MSELLDPQIFRTVLEGLHTGVYLVDLNRRIVFWNRGAEKISGFLAQDVLGRCCRDGILGHCNAEQCSVCESKCPLLETMRDGKPRQAELYLRHKHGHRVAVRIRAVPLRNEAGAIIGASESFDERYLSGDPGLAAISAESLDLFSRSTGLPSKTISTRVLNRQFENFREHLTSFAIFRIHLDDLDRFQADHGAEATDELLKVVASTMRNSLQPGDFLGCWEGREFLAVLTTRRKRTLSTIAERLRAMVANSGITWWGDRVSLTVSVGGAVIQAGDKAESLVDRAASALKHCMENGGNQVSISKGEAVWGHKGTQCL